MSDQKDQNPIITINQTHAIKTRGLYIFNPSFHCGLYCRAVYNAERSIFHDSFFTSNLYKEAIQVFVGYYCDWKCNKQNNKFTSSKNKCKT